MKKHATLGIMLLTLLGVAHLTAQPITLNWTNGTGTWDTTTNNWAFVPPTTPTNWVNGNNALISDPPGTVTVQAGGVSVNNVTMGSGSTVATWTLTGGDIALAGPASTWNTSGGTGSSHVIESVISGDSSLTKTGTRLLILAGNNTYSGDTINGASGTGVGSTLQIGNGGTTGSVAGNIVAGNRLTFNRSNTYTYNGVISGSSARAVTQAGLGTLIFTNANTYTNPTEIDAGTLQVDGSLASATVNVNDGGTLAGSGTLAGNVNVKSGSTLRPGSNTTGLLAISGALALAGTNTTNAYFELNGSSRGATYDAINVAGMFTAGGNLNLGLTYTPGSQIFQLVNYGALPEVATDFLSVTLSGSYNGSLTSLGGGLWTGTVGGYNFDLAIGASQMTLTTAIPEPSTYAALIGGLALLGVAGRRFRQRAK